MKRYNVWMKTILDEKVEKEVIGKIGEFFEKENKKIRENIAWSVAGILRSQKVNTAEIARGMGSVNHQSFKSNDMRVYRLLQSNKFQVDDRLWRGHFQLLFSFLRENGLQKKDTLTINVDYTSDRDDFLILYASVFFQGQSVPIYFSLRNYPKRKGKLDQERMEQAFFRELRHLLPDYYNYEIVADRGFGNLRIIKLLENMKFSYILRRSDRLLIQHNGREMLLGKLEHRDMDLREVEIKSWKRKVNIVKKIEGKEHWNLLVSLGVENPVGKYENRFSIEKMFKNKKSGGLDIENIQIWKYDRFKRIIFICCVAYSLYIFAGLWINNKVHAIKKNCFLRLRNRLAFSG